MSMLEIKRKMNAKRPDFIRSDAHKKKKLPRKWRKPTGHHNKMRLAERGYRTTVKVGYRSPGKVRYLELTGLKKTSVRNLNDLSKIDPKKECADISNTGMKKRMEMVREALNKKITIFNVKNPEAFLKECEEKLRQRKESKKKAEESKKDKEKTKEKVKGEAKKKEEKKEELSEEEKKEAEKREKEKILIKKQ